MVNSVEFGKALIAKCGVIVATVEDTIYHSSQPTLPPSSSSSSPSSSSTATMVEFQPHRLCQNVIDPINAIKIFDEGEGKCRRNEIEGRIGEEGSRAEESEGNSMIAIIHAGADLLLRTAYCPDKFSHRLVTLR